jgi:hypothetical protein
VYFFVIVSANVDRNEYLGDPRFTDVPPAMGVGYAW